MNRAARAFLPAIALAAALAIIAAGCAPQGGSPPEEARPLRVVRAGAGSGHANLVYAAEIRARYESDASFRVPGKIITRSVDLGSSVRRGQVIARIDPQDAQLTAASARATLAAAESDLEYARADLGRYQELLAKKFVSQGVYDQKVNAFRAAEARRDSARAQAGVSANQAAYASLAADADGVVTAILAEPGQVVAAGQPVLRVARLGEKDAVLNVAENQVHQLKAKPQARVALWALPGRMYSGRVREIAAAADPTTRTYTVKVAITDADDQLRWGMSANVGFVDPSGADPAIVLPATALTQTEDKAGARPAVWVVGSDGRVRLVPVEVARYAEYGVVLRSGLAGGEVVASAGVHKLRAGQLVKPFEETAPAAPTPRARPDDTSRVGR